MSIRVEFDRGQEPFWEVIDPDTGEVSYFKISMIYGVEVKEGPKEGDIVIKEEKIEEKKEGGLFEELFQIDNSEWEEAVEKFSQIEEVYPITITSEINWGNIYGE